MGGSAPSSADVVAGSASPDSQPIAGSAGEVAGEPVQAQLVKEDGCIEARSSMDDVLIVFVAVPTQVRVKDGVPDLVGELLAGSLFVLPAPSHTQRKPMTTVHFNRPTKLEEFAWITEHHMLLLSLGHDTKGFANTKQSLDKIFLVLKKFTWKLAHGFIASCPCCNHIISYPRMPLGQG